MGPTSDKGPAYYSLKQPKGNQRKLAIKIYRKLVHAADKNGNRTKMKSSVYLIIVHTPTFNLFYVVYIFNIFIYFLCVRAARNSYRSNMISHKQLREKCNKVNKQK